MQNEVQKGAILDTVNATGAIITAGSAVIVGNRIRVALDDIAIAGTGPCATRNVFNLLALTADTWADGATIYWDASNNWLTVESTSYVAGVAVGAKTSSMTTANVDIGKTPVAATTTGLTQQATIADVGAQTQDALTVTAMTGVANTSPAAETNLDTLTDSTGGTPSTTLAAVGAGGTGAAAGGWDTAGHRDSAILAINTNFSSVTAELALQKALNTVLINDAKSFAVELNKANVDVAALEAKINAILLSDETAGVRASS
jgi:predicted RecA/RadA family phage recombinase